MKKVSFVKVLVLVVFIVFMLSSVNTVIAQQTSVPQNTVAPTVMNIVTPKASVQSTAKASVQATTAPNTAAITTTTPTTATPNATTPQAIKSTKQIVAPVTLNSVIAPIASTNNIMSVYNYEKSDEILINPLIGWVVDARDTEVEQPHTLVYAGISWRDLEPQKGVYDFDYVEKKYNFKYWSDKGAKFIIRIIMDYPKSQPHKDIPEWLYNETQDGVFYDIDYGMGYSPNYSNKLLISYHEKLINALAKRYDTNPILGFMEIGSIGHWGEWHTKTYDGANIPFPSQEVCDIYIQQYTNSFKNKILMMRRPTKLAKSNKMGLFNDSFGDIYQTENMFNNWIQNGYKDQLTNQKQPAMPDFWKNAPSGGEVADYPGEQYFKNDRIDRTITQLKASHTSWLGPSAPIVEPSAELKANLDKTLNTMGYKFYIKSGQANNTVTRGSSISASVTMQNIGIAPFYYKWPFQFSIIDAKGNIVAKQNANCDIRKLLPDGELNISVSIKVAKSVAAGEYSLCCSINDIDSGKPSINFANKTTSANKALFQIGKVTIK